MAPVRATIGDQMAAAPANQAITGQMNVAPASAARASVVRRSVIPANAILHNATTASAIQHNAIQHSAAHQHAALAIAIPGSAIRAVTNATHSFKSMSAIRSNAKTIPRITSSAIVAA